MSPPAVVERPLFTDRPSQPGRTDANRRSSERSDGGRLTLEQRLDSVWEGLRAGGAADCPVCQGPMATDPGGAVARCRDCGSALS